MARPEVYWPVAVLLGLGMGLAVWHVWKRKADGWAYAVAAGWLVVALIPAVFSDEGVPHALRSILAIPAVFVLAGCGAHWMYTRLLSRVPAIWRIAFVAVAIPLLCYHVYRDYFELWAPASLTRLAFTASQADIASQINSLPAEVPKYVAVPLPGDSEHGTPMLAQTVVFLTRSYTERQRQQTNIRYLVPEKPLGPAEWGKFCREARDARPQAPVYCVLPE
jgi:hypothetical protein